MDFNNIIILLIGVALGFAIAYLAAKVKAGNDSASEADSSAGHALALNSLEVKNSQLLDNVKALENKRDTLQNSNQNLNIELATVKSEFDSLQTKLREQKEEITNIQTAFKAEFKELASDVLKEQSKDFKDKNESLLQPFREQIKSFQETVTKQITNSNVHASSFREQLDNLNKANHKISEDAQNLTKALKGDNKQQGNWGELILERVLESSELVKGQEYETQFSDTNDDDKRIQPDVIVHLPEDKHIIIDSKVSLNAYEKYVNADTDEERDSALKLHIGSFKSHIKGLSEKKYQSAKALTSPDFILMFIPIESSFGLAIKEDVSLFNYAWDKKIVMVSPSTLLATLKTIASIWKQEKQNKNVLLIAEESGKLYDKFVGFLEDLESIETNFKRVNTQFDDAKKKLSTGRGNIIGKVEKLKELGAKANKQISTKTIEGL